MGDTLRRYRSLLADSQRWEGFEFRDGDIVISTPSKCGTTWMQMICALLVFQDPELSGPLTKLSPWMDVQTDTIDNVRAALDAQTHRRFIKTHTPFDGLPHDERVTYISVGRDLRDAGLSWDNHFRNMNLEVVLNARVEAVGMDDIAELIPDALPDPSSELIERFWHWVDHDGRQSEGFSGLKAALHHLSTFWEHRDDDNVALFHYADLKADLEREMRRLASILNIQVPEEKWPRLVTAATFDRMRDRAEQLAPQVSVDGFWNDSARFFNEGSSGQWRSLLNDDDVARYEARARSLAPPDLIDWVHAPKH
ncbi:MAG: aryl sulfotransferase [Acidimicrobiaceae bacterium]